MKVEHREEPEIARHLEQQSEKDRPTYLLKIEHMTAFARSVINIERQMSCFPRDEKCMLVVEDTDQVKLLVTASHALLRDPIQIKKADWPEIVGLPLLKVVDTPHFAAKRDSALLQLADVCAFLIMRRLCRQEATQPFFGRLY